MMIGRRGFLGALAAAVVAPQVVDVKRSYFFLNGLWKPDVDYNYTQILRTPYGFTGRDAATDLYANRIIVDLTDEILLYQPSAGPLVTFVRGLSLNGDTALPRIAQRHFEVFGGK